MKIEEMIEVLVAFKEGKEIEEKNDFGWIPITNRDFDIFNFGRYEYRIKNQPTRGEVTANWVKENNIVVGSKVKVAKKEDIKIYWNEEMDKALLQVGCVVYIAQEYIRVEFNESVYAYDVESLEPYKEEWIPFDWEDRNEFRDKWVMFKDGIQEFKAAAITKIDINFNGYIATYEEAFEQLQFVDGSVFGKLKQ